MSPMMQRYMKSQTTSSSQDSAFAMGSRNQAILEINPEHPVIQKLRTMQQTAPDSEETEDMVMMVYETAALIGGYNIEDPIYLPSSLWCAGRSRSPPPPPRPPPPPLIPSLLLYPAPLLPAPVRPAGPSPL
ncbi:unnamed protein product [Prorocentrum cordatum]|uniref:Uncharacterized protein n=1 Tax=Prorocentrum cordatum TaxID=2364126 RepID=A0ABN9QXP2_9DINO|nr:unnamed protein product [Polarella glacialis]